MGKECGAWVSRRLWGGGNMSPLKTTAWEASETAIQKKITRRRSYSGIHFYFYRTEGRNSRCFVNLGRY